ncbi:MAG: TlpA family protein disulfide reductase [Verrucomicrobia bacterium]|nr:TlpA family protein disulfide reductase [Verrucomicrobiota bacterium]
MKTRFLSALVATSLLLLGGRAFAAEESKAKADLDELVGKVTVKLKDGKTTEPDLADELKEFDTLLAKYKDEKTDAVAQILLMKAMLYVQVIEDSEKGLQFLKQLKSDFPESTQGKKVDDMIASVEKQQEADKVKRALVVGTKFPDFEEKDTAGKPLAIANYKGKVVLLDFWATWCGPCVAELPNVLKTYEKYHEQGFEIIGISLDKDEEALNKFIKQKKMSWVQFFDGKGWQNKLATKYGINSIPATYLLDGEGKIIAKDLRGEALARAVGKALAKP